MLKGLRAFARSQAATALAGAVALETIFEAMRRLGNLKLYVVETIALALGAGIVYFVALYALEHSADSKTAFWLILAGALVFRLTLAPLEPTLSDDIHRYRWDGLVQQAGWNPYEVRPDDPRLTPLRDAFDSHRWRVIPGRDIPSVYPPLAELAYRMTWRVLPGPVGFKLPFLLADLLVVAMLAGWIHSTGEKNFSLAIYAWNPLVIIEFAASGHNDALALAFAVGALLIIRRNITVSTLLLTAAGLVKVFPAILMPAWLRKSGWKNVSYALALTAACGLAYGSAWAQIPDTLRYFASRWQNNHASLYTAIAWFSESGALAAGMGVGVVSGLAVWAAARRMDTMRAAYLLFGAILLLAPNGYSWYFTWMVPLLCFFPNPAWLLLTVLQFLSYNVLIGYQTTGRWHFDPLLQWLTYGPFYLWLLWRALRSEGWA